MENSALSAQFEHALKELRGIVGALISKDVENADLRNRIVVLEERLAKYKEKATKYDALVGELRAKGVL